MLNYERYAPSPDATLTDRSVTITTGGTAQDAAPANPNRVYLLIQNPSGNSGSVWFAIGTTATAASPAIELQPGQAWESQSSLCPTGAVSLIHATTGTKITVKEA